MKIDFHSAPKNIKTDVTCTHCGHVQKEYLALEKTTCRACGQVFWFKPQPPRRRLARPKVEKRSLVCHVCGENLLVPKDALSWQCHGCYTHLDVSDHEISGEHSTRIHTYGDVFVRPTSHLNAVKIEAGSLHVAGRVTGRVLCHHEIRVEGKAFLMSGAKAEQLHVSEGAELQVCQTIEVREANIFGTLHAQHLIVNGHLYLGPKASLTATRLQFRSLQAEPGSSVRAHANTLSPSTNLP